MFTNSITAHHRIRNRIFGVQGNNDVTRPLIPNPNQSAAYNSMLGHGF